MQVMDRRRWEAGALPVIARVEWRSERRRDEWPVALWVGGERLAVVVGERWVEGPAVAGAALVFCFVVHDGDGGAYLIRRDAASATTVLRAT